MGKEITKIPPHVLEALRQYPWPGNIRELENVIERALIDTKGPVLQLPEKINTSLAAAPAYPSKSLEAVERTHILQVLEEVSWKIDGKDGAAARLELNPSTLRSRMRKLAIVRKQQTKPPSLVIFSGSVKYHDFIQDSAPPDLHRIHLKLASYLFTFI
jgi:formate hydrogenlyase transcriptional activator